jgi:amino acid adenylation domain-containing protein
MRIKAYRAGGLDRRLCIHEFFERQAEKTPEAIAVVCGCRSLSYAELNRNANRLAHFLGRQGVGPNRLVGLFVERSLEMAVAILGILKAGGAYVPLDPEYPPERIAHMIDDSDMDIIVTQTSLLKSLPEGRAKRVVLDAESDLLAAESEANPHRGVTPDHFIYVIYTSGSTGKPKGSFVYHRGVVNLLDWYTNAFPWGEAARTLLMTSLSFDLTQKNLWAPLITGGTLYLFESPFYDAGLLLEAVERHRITLVNCTPSAFLGLLNPLDEKTIRQLQTLEYVILGGEPIPAGKFRAWLDSGRCKAQIVNSYGPTECSDVCTFYRLREYDRYERSSVPIGIPICNTEILLLDDDRRPVPAGAEGELCIGGAGVGGGYLKRPELTREKFVPHPGRPASGELIYRTGDRARFLATGELEFLGRADDQVKIRGFRVELGEIESVLAGQPGVQEGVVIARDDRAGEKQLAAYVVRRAGAHPSVSELRRALQTELPDYMLPTAWMFLDKMPLSPNGKIDRKALPAPDRKRPDLDVAYASPRSAFETYLAQMWSGLLDLDRVGTTDRFFELGGTSLQAIRFISQLSRDLGVLVPIVSFFATPTIAGLITALERDFPEATAKRFGAGTSRGPVGESGRTDRRSARGIREETRLDDVAIIGMAGRFPGAANVEEFWDNLRDGVESIVRVNADDLKACGVDPSVLPRPGYVNACAYLADSESFDAAFFGYRPREVELMDPQHRVFLECAWSALENAGYDAERYPGLIGVFGGVARNAYFAANLATHPDLLQSAGDYHILVPNEKDFPSTRVAYKMNLRGPAVNVQTACSSSGVAAHLACQSLKLGECDLALMGGCRVIVPTRAGYWHVEGGTLSPDGHVRAFDAEGAGMVRGSGVGFVVLKRLGDALRDGDRILAVIKGSAINNDGSDKAGFTAPSVSGQAEVIAAALEAACVDPRSVSYVEAHGTATFVGDPIEVTALTRVYGQGRPRKEPCLLGSVKTNIGHLDAGSGVAGIIKVILSFQHRQLPPSLNFRKPNPHIDFEHGPFRVNAALTEWREGETPRRAAVSSFGLGGTNVHILLEEGPRRDPSSPSRPWQLLPISARTETALVAVAANLAHHLTRHGEQSLADAAYTLQTGRRVFEHRRIVVCREHRDAAESLTTLDAQRVFSGTRMSATPTIVFMFPGQGAQHVNMGRGLYESEPVFAEKLNFCADILQPLLGFDLRKVFYPSEGQEDESAEILKQTTVTQPALFAIEYALACLWMEWGIRPDAMIGHSVGEYVAACLSGVFSPEDALRVLCERARLMQTRPSGAMLAARLPEEQAVRFFDDHTAIAGCNAPAVTVFSGPHEAMDALLLRLEAEGISARKLHTSHAFHSSMMDPVLEPFIQCVARVGRHEPQIPFVSGTTGDWIAAKDATDPSYWARQLRNPVRFSPGIRLLQKYPGRVFLEVGPSRTLSTLALQHGPGEGAQLVLASLGHAQERQDDQACMLTALGRLWIAGAQPDWTGFYKRERRCRADLPTYPFERKRCWIEPLTLAGTRAQPVEAAVSMEEKAPAAGIAGPTTRLTEDRVVDGLKRALHELSGLDLAALDETRSFLELGFDSLFLTQVGAVFQKKFAVKVTLRMLLDTYPTLNALAGYIETHLPKDRAATPQAKAAVPPPAEDAKPVSGLQAMGPFGIDEKPATKPPARHGPFSPYRDRGQSGLTERQQAYLDDLICRYIAKTRQSKERTQAHRAHFADPRTVAGFQKLWKEITYPIITTRSAGCRMWDVDGNEYTDITMGFGACLFGHGPEFVRDALRAQIEKGIEIGPQSEVAGEVASLVCEFTGMDRATFCNTGSEAVMGAVRVARTVTGRDMVVMFAGDYHGVHDEVLLRGTVVDGVRRSVPIAPGIPREAGANVIILDYGAPESLDYLRRHGEEIAAVLVEPVQGRRPEIQPVEFLREVRAVTEKTGTALIFDEVITGFRCHPRGAQGLFGIQADIGTYGKVVAGGMPIGVIAGRSMYMDAFDGGPWCFGDDSKPEAGVTFFAGTFVRHPLAMAAALAVLKHLKKEGPGLQERLNRRTGQLAGDMNDFLRDQDIPLWVAHFSSVSYPHPAESFGYFSLLFHAMREKGIHIWEGRPFFLSTAHNEQDLEHCLDVFKESLEDLRNSELLPRVPHAEAFPGLRLGAHPGLHQAPLTDAQREIWIATRFGDLASCAYNESTSLTLRGDLNVEALRRATDRLIERHEALRTTFSADGERQIIRPDLRIQIPFLDLSDLDEEPRRAELERLLRVETSTPLDLLNGPLIRAGILRLGERHHRLVMTAHHIVCDGWSYDVMMCDLGRLYETYCRGEEDLRPLPMQISDFARWLNGLKGTPEFKADEEYWKDRFRGALPVLDLPIDRPRPPVRTFAGFEDAVTIEPSVFGRAKELSASQGCTLYATVLSAYIVLLYRLTGQGDLIVGIPVAGQSLVGEHDLVGHCTNMLPLRFRLTGDETFAELMAQGKQVLLDAYEHQRMTFGAIVEHLRLPRDPARPPLISTSFNVDPAIHGLSFGGMEADFVCNLRSAFQFDIGFNLVAGDGLLVEVDYSTDLFDPATISRWADCYATLLKNLVEDPDQAVSQARILPEEERRRLLREWNNTAQVYPADPCIHQLIERTAERRPDHVAVTDGELSLTYRELNEQANRLSHRLRALGVTADTLVGICLERTSDMVAAVLGVLKAGGAYVPLDPGFPPARLAFMMEDSEAPVLISQPNLEAELFPHRAKVVLIGAGGEDLGVYPATNPAPIVTADNLAYLIYTSGSTGKPKGVQIPHRALMNFICSMQKTPGLSEQDVLLSVTTLSFDISGLEIFLPLAAGATVALAGREIVADGPRLKARLASSGATVMQATPATWRLLLDAGWAGDRALRILCGGEALPRELADELLTRGGELWNMYGPTETTIWSTIHKVQPGSGPVPIGRPIANTLIYILDRHKELVPVGVPGSLYIGGNGLARGYLKRPELTAEKFVSNPFTADSGGRIYQTGDLARYRENGTLEFLGRLDHQVKVRGFRIELGEIESLLNCHPAVRQAVVAMIGDASGGASLAAYIVPKGGGETDVQGGAGKHVEEWRRQWDKLFVTGLENISRDETPDLLIDAAILQWAGLKNTKEQVAEWIDATVSRILEMQPGRVLEIGCGTGQILTRIAPRCSRYVGTDFSEIAIRELTELLKRPDHRMPHVEILRRNADQFNGFEEAAFDTVIINSVVQYFPNLDYLDAVLENALLVVKPGGRIFVGDVQSYALLEMHHAADQLRRTEGSTSRRQLLDVVKARVAQENELVLDPEYFHAFCKGHVNVCGVEVWHRRGRLLNETVQYHYDVILHVGAATEPALPAEWKDWQRESFTVPDLRRILMEQGPNRFCVYNVPNARLARDRRVPILLRDEKGPDTADGILQALEKTSPGVDPEDLWDIEKELPYRVNVLWSGSERDAVFEAVFVKRNGCAEDIQAVPSRKPAERDLLPVHYYANNPAARKLAEELSPALRSFLKESLPDYMIPSSFTFLAALPLTPNRKVDRKALPEPDRQRLEPESGYAGPRDGLETMLVRLWEKLLGVKPVGIRDDFFDLGGHSMLAVRLFVELERTTGKNPPLATLFRAPTVEKLAAILREGQGGKEWSSLVTIQPAGANPPFFCIHGAGGNVLLYRDLARHLGPDQPFYGLQAQGLDGRRPFLTRIEDMAAHYIREIRLCEPYGPYYLGGYCLGGTIAFEMARQLEAVGEEVALLALFDTMRTWRRFGPAWRVVHQVQRALFHLGNLRMLSLQGSRAFLTEKAREARRRVRKHSKALSTNEAWTDPLDEKHPVVVLEGVNDRAAEQYQPGGYKGKVTVFKPRSFYAGMGDPQLGWGHDSVKGGVVVVDLPVYPAGMLVEPFVQNLARELKACLALARADQDSKRNA